MPSTGLCYVCKKEETQWCGYGKDKDGIDMGFCESCKEEWIIFAEKHYGIEFGPHPNEFGVRDGHNAHPINVSNERILQIWNHFVKKRVPFIFR